MRRGGISAAAALLVLSAGLGVTAEGDQVQPVTVLRATGDVSVLPAGSDRWRRPIERERLLPGTRIRTGADGEILLELSDRNLVVVGAGSDFSVDVSLVRRELTGERIAFFPARRNVHTFGMNLDRGNAGSVLRNLPGASRYDLATPVATAGVRGTVFAADVAGAGADVTANFSVLEGAVSVTGPSLAEAVTIPAGYSFQVVAARPVAPGAPAAAGPPAAAPAAPPSEGAAGERAAGEEAPPSPVEAPPAGEGQSAPAPEGAPGPRPAAGPAPALRPLGGAPIPTIEGARAVLQPLAGSNDVLTVESRFQFTPLKSFSCP